MSIRRMRTVIKKRQHQELYENDFKDIGSFLKKTRKKQNLTQDDVAKGICSISYLSKIENNQIIPSDYYVNEIMNRLEIDDEIYVKSKQHKQYLGQIIEAFFYEQDDCIHQIYQDIEDIKHDKMINLVKLAYYIYFNDENHSAFVMMLEELVGNMTNLELKFYLLLASHYYMKKNLYRTALELLLISDEIITDNEYITAMLYEIKYYIKNRLLMSYSAQEDYKKALFYFQHYNAMKRMIRMGIEKVIQITNEHPDLALKLLMQLKKGIVQIDNIDTYHILEAEIYFKLKKYQKALLVLKGITDESKHFFRKMVLMYEIFYIEDDFDMIKHVKMILKDYHPTQEEMHHKIHWHYLTAYLNDKKEYLRDIAIPFSIKTENIHKLKYYIDEIIDICYETHRYKEGLTYLRKYEKELKKTQDLLG